VIASKLVNAPTAALARRAARQDYGARQILSVRSVSAPIMHTAKLYRVDFEQPCPHCGGDHETELQCRLLSDPGLAAEIEPRGRPL
jgi:hypothetical protein